MINDRKTILKKLNVHQIIKKKEYRTQLWGYLRWFCSNCVYNCIELTRRAAQFPHWQTIWLWRRPEILINTNHISEVRGAQKPVQNWVITRSFYLNRQPVSIVPNLFVAGRSTATRPQKLKEIHFGDSNIISARHHGAVYNWSISLFSMEINGKI